MNRFLSTALFLLLAAGTVHCAAPTDDADVPEVDLGVEPNAISSVSTGQTAGSDSLDKKSGDKKKEEYLTVEIKNVLITSY